MKFLYLNNSAELLVVYARNFRESSPREHYDFYDDNNAYIGYLSAVNDVDVDPKQAANKAARRIERQLTDTRREIKEQHERAKMLKAASDAAASKDVSGVQPLPTMQEQMAAKHEEDRRRKEAEDRLRGTVIKSVDPFDEFWSEMSQAEQPRYGLALSPMAQEVARIVRHYEPTIPTTRVRTVQEVAREYNVPVAALTLNAVSRQVAAANNPDLSPYF